MRRISLHLFRTENEASAKCRAICRHHKNAEAFLNMKKKLCKISEYNRRKLQEEYMKQIKGGVTAAKGYAGCMYRRRD